MNHPPLSLSPTLAPLVAAGLTPRAALQNIAESGFRFVQLSAALPTMRPRELDRSARRDLNARLRRLELTPAGLDLWIPLEHFTESAALDRATQAVLEALELAADLGQVPLSIEFPENLPTDIKNAISARADTCNVAIADFTIPTTFGNGIDPACDLITKKNPARRILNADDLVAVRFSDADRAGRVTPGSGRLEILEYQIALTTAQFKKPITLDLRSLPNPLQAASHANQAWHSTGLTNNNQNTEN